jgi:hypothetical protein
VKKVVAGRSKVEHPKARDKLPRTIREEDSPKILIFLSYFNFLKSEYTGKLSVFLQMIPASAF